MINLVEIFNYEKKNMLIFLISSSNTIFQVSSFLNQFFFFLKHFFFLAIEVGVGSLASFEWMRKGFPNKGLQGQGRN